MKSASNDLQFNVHLLHGIPRPVVKKSAQSDLRFNSYGYFSLFFWPFLTILGKMTQKISNVRQVASHLNHFSNLTYNSIFKILDPPVQGGGGSIFFWIFFAFYSVIYIGAVFKPVASMHGHKNSWLSTPYLKAPN